MRVHQLPVGARPGQLRTGGGSAGDGDIWHLGAALRVHHRRPRLRPGIEGVGRVVLQRLGDDLPHLLQEMDRFENMHTDGRMPAQGLEIFLRQPALFVQQSGIDADFADIVKDRRLLQSFECRRA